MTRSQIRKQVDQLQEKLTTLLAIANLAQMWRLPSGPLRLKGWGECAHLKGIGSPLTGYFRETFAATRARREAERRALNDLLDLGATDRLNVTRDNIQSIVDGCLRRLNEEIDRLQRAARMPYPGL